MHVTIWGRGVTVCVCALRFLGAAAQQGAPVRAASAGRLPMHPSRAPCAGRLQPIGRAAQHRCLWAAQHPTAAPIGLPRLNRSVSRPEFSHALAARWRPRSASGAVHAQAADDDGLGSEQRSEASCSSSGRQPQQHGLQNLQGIAASALRTTVAVSTLLLAGLATAVRPAHAATAR